jgi:hypothetical protein
MLDLSTGAPELVAELLRACLDAVTCVRAQPLCAARLALTPALWRCRSPANVAHVEMDMTKARAATRMRAPVPKAHADAFLCVTDACGPD